MLGQKDFTVFFLSEPQAPSPGKRSVNSARLRTRSLEGKVCRAPDSRGPDVPHTETACRPGSRHTHPALRNREDATTSCLVMSCLHPPHLASCCEILLLDSPGQAVTGPRPSPLGPSFPVVRCAPGCGLGNQDGRDRRASRCLEVRVSQLEAGCMSQRALPWTATFPGVWVCEEPAGH